MKNENSPFCKIIDFFRPMTKYTVTEDCNISLDLLESEDASAPCCSCTFTEKKKINLFRILALGGMMIFFICLLCSICCCMKKNR